MYPSPSKVLFLGYGKIGCSCLEHLVAQGIQVLGVVPRTSDNDTETNAPSVASVARILNIPLIDGDKLGCNDFLSSLKTQNLDYVISIQYDKIIKENLINTPKKKCLNLHFSPLPKLRGCYPTKWAIIEEDSSGVTLHEIDKGIDTGSILDQKTVKLNERETDKTLYLRLAKEADVLFASNVCHIKERDFPEIIPQLEGKATYHPKRLPYDGQLDWNNSLDFCDRLLRAFTFPPFPPVSCVVGNRRIGLFGPVKTCPTTSGRTPGEFHLNNNGTLSVQCVDGRLTFDTIWYQGQILSPLIFPKLPKIN